MTAEQIDLNATCARASKRGRTNERKLFLLFFSLLRTVPATRDANFPAVKKRGIGPCIRARGSLSISFAPLLPSARSPVLFFQLSNVLLEWMSYYASAFCEESSIAEHNAGTFARAMTQLPESQMHLQRAQVQVLMCDLFSRGRNRVFQFPHPAEEAARGGSIKRDSKIVEACAPHVRAPFVPLIFLV